MFLVMHDKWYSSSKQEYCNSLLSYLQHVLFCGWYALKQPRWKSSLSETNKQKTKTVWIWANNIAIRAKGGKKGFRQDATYEDVTETSH